MRFEHVAAYGMGVGLPLLSSFFHQLESAASRDVSGLASTTVVAIKGALYAIALVALALSIRSAAASRGAAA